MPTLATSLLHALRDHGAGEIFGIPGEVGTNECCLRMASDDAISGFQQ